MVLAWALLIFGLSSIPNNFEPSESRIPADKIVHGFEFGVLALLMAWAFARSQRANVTVAHVAASLILSSAYGVSDEVHQYFVPGRDVTLGDFLADVIGAGVGACVAYILGRARTRSSHP